MATKKITKKSTNKVTKKVEAKAEETKEVKTNSNKGLYILIALGAIIILAGIGLIFMSPSDDSNNDAQVIGAAVEQSKDAMSAVENDLGLTILRTESLVTNDGTNYLVSFSIENSVNYTAFDVMLDMDLNLEYVGLDGVMKIPGTFLMDYVELTNYQKCAKLYNENALIPNLIANNYLGNSRQRSIMTISPKLECNGEKYPYDLEIGDGYVKTTLKVNGEGHYFTNSINKGIVVGTLKAPSEDISKGVFVYVDQVGENLIALTYELKDKSAVAFDDYDMGLLEDYSIQVAPSIVWNCKFVNAGTKATGELNGTFLPGSEELSLKTLACIFNNGYPEDICSSIGIVRDENGTISASVPTEYYLTMYQTGLDSCKPDEDIVKAQAFYPLDGCDDCENQRKVLDKVANDFGEYMDLNYYCIGNANECQSFVDAR